MPRVIIARPLNPKRVAGRGERESAAGRLGISADRGDPAPLPYCQQQRSYSAKN
jgi:hypothetical protein